MAAPDVNQSRRVSGQELGEEWYLLTERLRKSPRLCNELNETFDCLIFIFQEGMRPN